MNHFSQNQKLQKLKYLLQNSKIKTLSNSALRANSQAFYQNNLQQENQNLLTSCFDKKQEVSLDLSKDLSLFLDLIEKPINLLFSIDQFLFEFSKQTYQQKKTSEFFQQIKERKKLSLFYGHLTQKQILNSFNKIKKNKGYFSKNFFSLLEKRLDVVLYRSGFTKTILEARQLIKHKKILINQKIVNIPSFVLSPGDCISLTLNTGNNLNIHLLDSLKNQQIKTNRKTAGDFYLKKISQYSIFDNKRYLKNKVFLNFKGESGKKFASNFLSMREMPSKKICQLLIQLISLKIKLRCFFNLKKQKFYLNRLSLENSNTSSLSLNKFVLTRFKWRKTQKKKYAERFGASRLEHYNTFYLSKLIKKNIIYANQGCLQKKPVFWNQGVSLLKQKRFFIKANKKDLKFLPLKNKNLILYRKSFLFFLQDLENSRKFTNLITLNVKKSLLKKSFSQQKFYTNPNTIFSKNLNFRLLRPLNLEISYNLLNIVYLYSPQRINFPFFIDLDLIQTSFR